MAYTLITTAGGPLTYTNDGAVRRVMPGCDCALEANYTAPTLTGTTFSAADVLLKICGRLVSGSDSITIDTSGTYWGVVLQITNETVSLGELTATTISGLKQQLTQGDINDTTTNTYQALIAYGLSNSGSPTIDWYLPDYAHCGTLYGTTDPTAGNYADGTVYIKI